MMTKLPFSRVVDVARLGAPRTIGPIEATPEERAAIAGDLGILGVDSLAADVELSRWHGAGIRLDGRLKAVAQQACVVTLDPVRQEIDESFTRTYLPPEAMARDPKTVAEAEIVVAFDEEDPPEPLDGTTIDIGRVLTEQLALSLDPYPRVPGAVLASEQGDGEEADGSPFAVLSRLRDK